MRENVAIHSTAVVAPQVEIGPGTVIGPFAVVLGPCTIGAACWIGPHAVIGTTAEHVDHMIVQRAPDRPVEAGPELDEEVWHGAHGAGVVIGDRTIVREHTSIQQGTGGPTRIGADAFLMSKVYVAHDCQIGDRVRMASLAALGGHVSVGEDANIGMAAAVHQHRAIGAGAMIGMNATVVADIPPFAVAKGTPARVSGVNRVLLERLGHPADAAEALAVHQRDGGEPPQAFAHHFAAWSARRS